MKNISSIVTTTIVSFYGYSEIRFPQSSTCHLRHPLGTLTVNIKPRTLTVCSANRANKVSIHFTNVWFFSHTTSNFRPAQFRMFSRFNIKRWRTNCHTSHLTDYWEGNEHTGISSDFLSSQPFCCWRHFLVFSKVVKTWATCSVTATTRPNKE